MTAQDNATPMSEPAVHHAPISSKLTEATAIAMVMTTVSRTLVLCLCHESLKAESTVTHPRRR